MTVETATYISGLNATLPTGADAKAEGDDHIRLLKSTILASFPGITGAMTATHTQLNKLSTALSIASAPNNSLQVDASGNGRFTGTRLTLGALGTNAVVEVDGSNGAFMRGQGITFQTVAGGNLGAIDTSGNLLLGQSTAGAQDLNSMAIQPSIGQTVLNHATGTVSGVFYVGFYYGGGAIGSIAQSGTTGVSFNTTSDARLKTPVGAPSQGRIGGVVIRDFKWKSDGSAGRGVFAQELAGVIPEAVTVGGDDEGIQPWAVDYSKLVPDLVIEVQALRREIEELKRG